MSLNFLFFCQTNFSHARKVEKILRFHRRERWIKKNHFYCGAYMPQFFLTYGLFLTFFLNRSCGIYTPQQYPIYFRYDGPRNRNPTGTTLVEIFSVYVRKNLSLTKNLKFRNIHKKWRPHKSSYHPQVDFLKCFLKITWCINTTQKNEIFICFHKFNMQPPWSINPIFFSFHLDIWYRCSESRFYSVFFL